MKLSISLSDQDLEALDSYVRAAGASSRSAAIQQAIRLLRDPHLEDAYGAAWDEWQASGDAAAWEMASTDGLDLAAR